MSFALSGCAIRCLQHPVFRDVAPNLSHAQGRGDGNELEDSGIFDATVTSTDEDDEPINSAGEASGALMQCIWQIM